MKTLVSLFFLSLITSFSLAQEITGDWHGVLSVEGRELGIIFHITETDEGYTSTMDSPDQNSYGIPAASTTFENNELDVKAPDIGGLHYRGKLEKDTLSGSFRQGGALIPLKLYRKNPEDTKKDKPE